MSSFSSKQPTLFEVFGRSQSPTIPEVNEEALNRLTDALTLSGEEMGKVVLLRSPRAGYGKTFLLQGASNRLSESFRFLAVEPSGGGRIDGEVVLESVLRQLSEVLPASGGLTEFDLFARKLLALGLKPLLISGEIPSHDREGALFAIENRPIETFDFHHQQAATAHWTQANFEVLGPRLASELSEISGCNLRGCAYWVDLLFRYATTPPEKVERTRLLNDAVFSDLQGSSNNGTEERLQGLLALLSLIEPVVLVFDETEGLSNQPDSGLRLAAFIVQLRQACPALTVILSVNEDVWETGLAPLMPGGLVDRLTEFEVSLDELSRTDAEKLLRSRFGDDAGIVIQHLTWERPLFARGILREGTQIARELEEEGKLVSATAVVEDLTSISPPPLETASKENLETMAQEVLGPETGFEADVPAQFLAAEQEEKPRIESENQVQQGDPFGEVEFTGQPETPEALKEEEPPSPIEVAGAGSPFEIVPEKTVVSSTQEVPAEVESTPPHNPFDVVPENTAASPNTTGEWSAENAVEQFAASNESAEVNSPFEQPSATESPFDVVTPQEEVSAPAQSEKAEASPFQILKDEQERQEEEMRAKEAAAAQEAQRQAVLAKESAFVVSEPTRESQPSPSTSAPSELPVQNSEVEVPAYPFAIHQEEPIKPAEVEAQAPREPAPQTVQVPAVAEVVREAPIPAEQVAMQPEVVREEEPPARSPFAAVAPSTQPASGEDSANVEELLNQFKKRFGQPD